jgi:hypothetical protein
MPGSELPPQERARELAHESAAIERDSPTRKTYAALAGALKIMGMGSMKRMLEQGAADMGLDTLHSQERAAVNHLASEMIGLFSDFRKGVSEKIGKIATEVGANGEDAVTVTERLYSRSEVEQDSNKVTDEMIREEFGKLKQGSAE